MTDPSPLGIRLTPNPDVSTAAPAATGPDFKTFDSQTGWTTVNGWTYRLFRFFGTFLLPDLDWSGVEPVEESSAPAGMHIVVPQRLTGDGALLLIHGGGFVVGSSSNALLHATVLARDCGLPVFCPAYRLGPEHPFPAGLDDCHEAWSWLQANAERLNVDPAKVIIAGISAGGGHAASLAQWLHDEGGQQPAGQVLFYPMLDDRTAADRELDAVGHRVWNNRSNLFGWSSYLGQPPGGSPQRYASPARREDLSGLPPAWIGVGGADLFLDEDRDYTRRLDQAGVHVVYVEVDNGIHAFDSVLESPLTKAFHQSAAVFIRHLVG